MECQIHQFNMTTRGTDDDGCRKKTERHNNLSAGMVTFGCIHGIQLGK